MSLTEASLRARVLRIGVGGGLILAVKALRLAQLPKTPPGTIGAAVGGFKLPRLPRQFRVARKSRIAGIRSMLR
jgi:hypothetical protein